MDHIHHPSIRTPFHVHPGRKQHTLVHCARLQQEDLNFVGRLERLLGMARNAIIGLIRNT